VEARVALRMSMSKRWRSPTFGARTREPIDQETSADPICPSPQEAPSDTMTTQPSESVLVVEMIGRVTRE